MKFRVRTEPYIGRASHPTTPAHLMETDGGDRQDTYKLVTALVKREFCLPSPNVGITCIMCLSRYFIIISRKTFIYEPVLDKRKWMPKFHSVSPCQRFSYSSSRTTARKEVVIV